MAAKKNIPVRLKSGSFVNKEIVDGKEVEVTYKAHEKNMLFLGVAEAKDLIERFQNKFEILNQIEYKMPEESEPKPEEAPEEPSESTEEDYGTEVTKSFDEAKGTGCTVYTKDNLYTVINSDNEVVKQGISEVAVRKTLKKLQPIE